MQAILNSDTIFKILMKCKSKNYLYLQYQVN